MNAKVTVIDKSNVCRSFYGILQVSSEKFPLKYVKNHTFLVLRGWKRLSAIHGQAVTCTVAHTYHKAVTPTVLHTYRIKNGSSSLTRSKHITITQAQPFKLSVFIKINGVLQSEVNTCRPKELNILHSKFALHSGIFGPQTQDLTSICTELYNTKLFFREHN
jgi:hypothetical protein